MQLAPLLERLELLLLLLLEERLLLFLQQLQEPLPLPVFLQLVELYTEDDAIELLTKGFTATLEARLSDES